MDSVWLVFCSDDYTPACFSSYQRAKVYKEHQEYKGRKLQYFGCNPLDVEVVQ